MKIVPVACLYEISPFVGMCIKRVLVLFYLSDALFFSPARRRQGKYNSFWSPRTCGKVNTNVFGLSQRAGRQIQMFLGSANVREGKYKCFWVQRTCGKVNTNVFGFSGRAGRKIQMFLASANVREGKYKCIWSQY